MSMLKAVFDDILAPTLAAYPNPRIGSLVWLFARETEGTPLIWCLHFDPNPPPFSPLPPHFPFARRDFLLFEFDLLIQTHLPFPPLFVSPAFSFFFSPRLLPSFLFLFVFSAETPLFNSRSPPGLLPSRLPRHLVRPAGALLLRRMHARPSSLGVFFLFCFVFVFGQRPRLSAFPFFCSGSGSEAVICFSRFVW